MKYRFGQIFGKKDIIDILLHNSKKSHFKFLSYPLSVLVRIFGIPRTFNYIDLKRCLLNDIKEQIFFIDRIVEVKPENFLEMGSSWGSMALTLEDIVGSKGICTDLDVKELNIFNNISKHLNTKIEFAHGDINELNFENEIFDLIYSREFLTHVSSPSIILKKAYKWLNKNGKFIFQVAYHYEESELRPITKTGHKTDFKWNGFNEKSFEKFNDGLFDFKYHKVGIRDYRYDPCTLCSDERKAKHYLKLVGIGTKIN